ncbi:hypothetical protein [Tateyamaria pelophila]|uniref:hypothetical protein n=1 Tax=Tateyamaria pelophila TaxID=328415 RepID=UPI001CBF415B|nr:hypothetical protein [Tateyamaria pelophila]
MNKGVNPTGRVFGKTVSGAIAPAPSMQDLAETRAECGAHSVAMTRLRKGARVVAFCDTSAVTDHRIGDYVATL